MKVLAISSSAGLLGAAKSFELAVRGAAAHGLVPIVVCPSSGPLVDSLASHGIRVHVIAKDPEINEHSLEGPSFRISAGLAGRAAARLRYIWRLRALIRQEHIELVYLNTIRNAASALAARWSRCPIVWHLREPERDFLGVRRLRLLVVKATADRVIAVSEYNRRALVRLGISAGRISTVYNGIDAAAFSISPVDGSRSTRPPELPLGRPIVGMVGMWAPHKGVLDFLEMTRFVVERLPQVTFVIVGGPVRSDSAYAAAVSTYMKSESVRGRIVAVGYRDEVRPYIAAMDVFVMPSHIESFSRVVLEAMASARPIVATRVGGTPEAIVDGESGLLCSPGAPGALAAGVCRLLDEPGLARSMGLRARRRVEEEFSLEQYERRVQAAWRSTLEEKSASRKGTCGSDLT
jgi:glycosyltransferase involved in cell wall biosynthesis